MNQITQIWWANVPCFVFLSCTVIREQGDHFQVCKKSFGFNYFSSNQPDWTHHTDKDTLKAERRCDKHTNMHSRASFMLNIHTNLTWEPVIGLLWPVGQLYSEPRLLAQMERLEGGWHDRAGHPCCHVKPDCCLLCLERERERELVHRDTQSMKLIKKGAPAESSGCIQH